MTKEMNVNQRAVQFLIGVACRRETTYYEAIAEHCGLPTQGNQLSMVVSKLLGEVFCWCEKKGWPPLTALVVRKSGKFQGTHGLGFWKIVEDTNLLHRVGIDDSEGPLNEVERIAIGKFLIVKCWNYFADLNPVTNVSAVTVGTDYEIRSPGMSDHQEEFGNVMRVLQAIPGFASVPDEYKDRITRGQTVIGAESIQDTITASMLEGKSSTVAWKLFFEKPKS